MWAGGLRGGDVEGKGVGRLSVGGRLSARILKIVNSRGIKNLVFGLKLAKIVNSLKNISIFVVYSFLFGSPR